MSKDNTSSFFREFQNLYTNNKFDEGIELLLSHKQNLEPGLFFYNLGTLYLKKGNLGVARFHLEKAKKEGFHTERIEKNLRIVEESLGREGLVVGNTTLDFVNLKGGSFSKYYFESASLLLLATALVIFYRFRHLWKVGVAVLVLSIVPLSVYKIHFEKLNYGVFLKDSIVREGPSAIFEKSHDVMGGTKVVIGDSNKDWLYIVYPSDLVGWVNRSDLGIF